MPRSELDFHVYRPELGELPARANAFNDWVQSKPAPAIIPNPCLPAPPRPKIGDTLSVRAPYRYIKGTPDAAARRLDVLYGFSRIGPSMSVRVTSDDSDPDSAEGMEAEKDQYAAWLKRRETAL